MKNQYIIYKKAQPGFLLSPTTIICLLFCLHKSESKTSTLALKYKPKLGVTSSWLKKRIRRVEREIHRGQIVLVSIFPAGVLEFEHFVSGKPLTSLWAVILGDLIWQGKSEGHEWDASGGRSWVGTQRPRLPPSPPCPLTSAGWIPTAPPPCPTPPPPVTALAVRIFKSFSQSNEKNN